MKQLHTDVIRDVECRPAERQIIVRSAGGRLVLGPRHCEVQGPAVEYALEGIHNRQLQFTAALVVPSLEISAERQSLDLVGSMTQHGVLTPVARASLGECPPELASRATFKDQVENANQLLLAWHTP